MADKRLTRSNDKKLTGVCGGIAEYFSMDPTVVRIIYTILTLCTCFCGVLVYIILSFIMPAPKDVTRTTFSKTQEPDEQ